MQKLHVIGVVVTYNRLSDLKITLARALAQSFDQLVVVDNASTDGTADYLQDLQGRYGQRLHLIRLDENLGGAGGFHHGLAHVARAHRLGELPKASWCVLFDDDAYPELGCVEHFRRQAPGYGQAAAVAATVLDGQGQVAEVNRPILNIFRHPSRLGLVWRSGGITAVRDLYHMPKARMLQPQGQWPVDAISFVGLFLQMSQLAELAYPLPDPRLFIYSDDTLYTARLGRCGAQLLLDAGLRFIHNTQTGYSAGVIQPIWKLFYLTRNSWYVYRELAGWWLGPLLFGLGLAAKLRTSCRYPQPLQRRQARAMIRLGLADLWRRRRWRSLADVIAATPAARAPGT